MIRLENVAYAYFRGKSVFSDLTLELPTHRRMAVLGPAECGKSTFINLLAGLIDPLAGRIERLARLSYPVGYSRAFRFGNTVRQNLIFAARIYDAEPEEVVDFVSGITGLVAEMDRPMRDLPIPTRLSLGFALTYALPFDCYLFDNIIGPGDPATRDLWRQLYEARTASAGSILATRQPKVAELYCDCALVLRRSASPVFCDDIRVALALFEEDQAQAAKAPPRQANAPVIEPVIPPTTENAMLKASE